MVKAFLMDQIGGLLVKHQIWRDDLAQAGSGKNGIHITTHTGIGNLLLEDPVSVVQGIYFTYRDLDSTSVLLDIYNTGLFLKRRSGKYTGRVNMRESILGRLSDHVKRIEIHGGHRIGRL